VTEGVAGSQTEKADRRGRSQSKNLVRDRTTKGKRKGAHLSPKGANFGGYKNRKGSETTRTRQGHTMIGLQRGGTRKCQQAACELKGCKHRRDQKKILRPINGRERAAGIIGKMEKHILSRGERSHAPGEKRQE